MSKRKEKIITAFNTLRADNLHILNDFYHPEVVFIDPIGTVSTLDSLKSYYKNMYDNVQDITFDFEAIVEEEQNVSCMWTMRLKAKSLNSGREVAVQGTSLLVFDQETGLVTKHRDYFDMGEFIYEYIPLLGSAIRLIKKKIGH